MIYLVATPIGNLKDITIRALEILKKADVIACEDTRTTKVLLDNYEINKRLISYHKFNEYDRADEIIEMALSGLDIAIVSDAGMPGISDPGNIMVKKAIEKGIKYTVIPGASAFTTALVLSGFNNESFVFRGFLPNKGSERNKILKEISGEAKTQILYESPHKIDKTMEDFLEFIPDRKVAIVREISKMFETVNIFRVDEYKDQDIVKKGEMVIVIDSQEICNQITDEFIFNKLIEEINKGESKKSAVKNVCKEFDLPKNRVYQISLNI